MKIAGLDKKTIECEGTFMPDLTDIEGGKKLKVIMSKVEETVTRDNFKGCRYRNIYRHDTNDNKYTHNNWSKPFKDSIQLTKDTEFIEVECINTTSEVVSKTFYCLIPEREPFSGADFLNLKKREVMFGPRETLDIIMLGMDTLTRNHFLRACNKTYSYLMSSLQSFDLTMHSQLGENTFPNFLPLFAGQSYNETTRWWSDKYHMDNIDWLWGTFEKAGYLTLYTEDWPSIAAFNYLKKGFRNPFARYNTRPLTLAMSKDKHIWKHDKHCAGNQVDMNFLLDYVRRFLDAFPDRPHFAVAMLSKPAHNTPTNAKMFDEHLLHFYQSLNQSGQLNKSVLISFSDHGVRWGPLRRSKNGIFESRTPYTILTFPDWFLRKYPDVAANLKLNTRRLTSHFDTHATLLDLLYFKCNTTSPLTPLRHGISLLEKIPWNRTCADAAIPEEYCLCGYKSIAEVDSKSKISKTLTKLVIDALNSKTDKNICAVFSLDKVISVLKSVFEEANYDGETTLYKVKLQVTPGKAKFEASVFAKGNSTVYRVANTIDRVNIYLGQADCMEIAAHRPFCYCNNLLLKVSNESAHQNISTL